MNVKEYELQVVIFSRLFVIYKNDFHAEQVGTITRSTCTSIVEQRFERKRCSPPPYPPSTLSSINLTIRERKK